MRKIDQMTGGNPLPPWSPISLPASLNDHPSDDVSIPLSGLSKLEIRRIWNGISLLFQYLSWRNESAGILTSQLFDRQSGKLFQHFASFGVQSEFLQSHSRWLFISPLIFPWLSKRIRFWIVNIVQSSDLQWNEKVQFWEIIQKLRDFM
jgi:hypothetical protein